LDRVKSAEISEETYIRPSDFDSLEYVTRSIAMTPAPWLVDVLLETTLEEARKIVPPALATLEQTSGGVIFRCYVNRLEWIAHFLAGLDCPIVIRQPEELREALQKLAEKIIFLAEK
jgi:predicted DNA-binding transcriptional regulator YafY